MRGTVLSELWQDRKESDRQSIAPRQLMILVEIIVVRFLGRAWSVFFSVKDRRYRFEPAFAEKERERSTISCASAINQSWGLGGLGAWG